MRKRSRESHDELSTRIGVDLPASIVAWTKKFRGDWGFETRNPADPVDSLPGSAQRIVDYQRRVALGQPIFIEGDRVGATRPLAYQSPAAGHRIVLRGDDRRGCLYCPMYTHRYLRWYRHSQLKAGRHVVFIGFMPDETFDQRACAWSILHRMHRCSVVNLYATLIPGISDQRDPIGDLTDVVIRHVLSTASIVIAAWGHETDELFDREVIERAAWVARAVRKQCDHMHIFGFDRGQPIGIDISLPLQRAPLLEMESELMNHEDDDQ